MQSLSESRCAGQAIIGVLVGVVLLALPLVAMSGILPSSLTYSAATWLPRALDQVAAKAGLAIGQVSISGYANTLEDDVFGALQTEASESLVAYDVEAAETRLAQLPWVQSAHVSRRLPSGLDVMIRERVPFAVWQHRQMLFVIDREGRTLAPVAPGDYSALPRLAGEGADREAGNLMEVLARHPRIAARVIMAIRIGDRRWTLRQRNGLEILLPADGVEEGLAWLAAADARDGLLTQRLGAIDLRVRGQMTLAPLATGRASRGT